MKKIILPSIVTSVLLLIVFWLLTPLLMKLTYSPLLNNKLVGISLTDMGWETKTRILVCLSALVIPLFSIALASTLKTFKNIPVTSQKFLKNQTILMFLFLFGIAVRIFLYHRSAQHLSENPFPFGKMVKSDINISQIVIHDIAVAFCVITAILLFVTSKKIKVAESTDLLEK